MASNFLFWDLYCAEMLKERTKLKSSTNRVLNDRIKVWLIKLCLNINNIIEFYPANVFKENEAYRN